MALYNRLRLAELTQLCQDRDLDTSGRKADLIARLLESDAKTDEAVGPNEGHSPGYGEYDRPQTEYEDDDELSNHGEHAAEADSDDEITFTGQHARV